MAKTIVNEETGVEEVVYTQAEIDAQIAAKEAEFNAKLADKDTHVKGKLDEFEKGKQAQALKDAERDGKISEAERIAREASEKATLAEQKRVDAIKNMIKKNYTGGDADLTAKFDEAWELVNIDIKEDADIEKRAAATAKLAGLDSNPDFSAGGMPMGGGYAPNFVKKNDEKSKEEHSKFESVLGLDKFIEESGK